MTAQHPTPKSEPTRQFRRVGAAARNGRSTPRIGEVCFGAPNFVLIAGPCAVESEAMIDTAAQAVAQAGARVLRGGAFKPRTSPDAFQGLGLAGVELLARAAQKADMPMVTEVLSADLVETMLPMVDAFQIGARNMQNFALLQAVGETGAPVILKRHFGATLTEWLLAAEYIAKAGSSPIILCERGVRTFGQETRFTLDLAGAMWAREETHLPVIIDPSHAIGLPELIPGAVAAALAAGLDGAMIEVHPAPEHARCDAQQALRPAEFSALVDRLSPLAASLGRML